MPDSYGGFPPSQPINKKTAKRPASRAMDEQRLLAMLRREEADAASYYTSELAQVQTDAMDAYNGKLRGDILEPNRSQHVTHDIEDTINWIMPALMRAFAPGDDFITLDDDNLDDNDPNIQVATDYLRHVYFKDNPGETNTHDFAFDALLQKVGIMRVYWEDPQPEPPYIIEGATSEDVEEYENDPEYTILEAVQDGVEPDETEGTEELQEAEHQAQEQPQGQQPPQPGQPPQQQPGGQQVTPLVPQQPQPEPPEPTYTLKVQRQRLHGKACCEAIPPEEFRVSRRARSVAHADYHGWQHDEFLANLVRLHPDKAREIDPEGNYQAKPSDVNDTDGDVRVLARFPDEPSSGQRATYNEESRHKVVVMIEYIRVDFDGDGIVELRRVKRCGNIILENDLVDESEFVVWSPIRVSHRLIGRSVADTLLDIQRIRTALVRRAMDSLARSTAPRTFINRRAVADDPTILDRILDHDIGDVIDIDGSPGDMIQVVTTPDVSQPCFQAIDYMDRRAEEASGVTRGSQGIRPDQQHDTASGIDKLQSAANARIEQVARWLGCGLEVVFAKLLRCVVRNQDHARVVKLSGKRMAIDPRRWSDEMTVSVHVGMAGESRDRRIAMLNDIKNDQVFALTQLGPSNPLCGMHEMQNTLRHKAQAMGFKNPSMFWKQVPENWQPQQQQPQQDPKLVEIQGKQQLAQQELQSKIQLQQAELQHKDKVASIDAQHKMASLQQQGRIQLQIEGTKAQSEHEIAKLKLASETEIAQQKMAQELQLAREKMDMEGQLARETMQMNAAGPRVSGFRQGGKLDA